MEIIKGFIGKYIAGESGGLEGAGLLIGNKCGKVRMINARCISLLLILENCFEEHTAGLDVAEVNGIHVIFRGEAYNIEELYFELDMGQNYQGNISPSYVAGLLFLKYGVEFASKINGMFSIVLWDERDDSLYLYADRFGAAFPIYYFLSSKLIFASQLRLLLQSGEVSKEIDPYSLAAFLKYSYIPAPGTIIRNIKKLGPGEVLIYRRNEYKKMRYIDFKVRKIGTYSEEEAIERYVEVLTRSILKKMKGFKAEKIGFLLSGGLDSSANVALASTHGDKGFRSFGIGFDDPNLDERPYARLAARHFGIEFIDYLFDGHEIEDLPRMVWHLDEPFMENGLFLTYAGFKAAKDYVDLIIAGDGADQLFGTGGFGRGRPIALRYLLDRLKFTSLFDKAKEHLLGSLFYRDNFLFKAKVMLGRSVDFNDWFFWGYDDEELKRLCNYSIPKGGIKPFSNQIENSASTFADYYEHALIHQDIEHYVCQNVLVKSYRMAELFGLHLREAYLDYEVIDFLLSLSFNLKTKGNVYQFLKGSRVTKYLHRAAMRDILPEGILKKSKQGGFIPMKLLLTDSNKREKIYTYLLNSDHLKKYMNMDFISNLLKQYEKSITNRMYWQSYHDSKVNQIMNLLVFCLWCDLFFGKAYTEPPDCVLSQFISKR
jgi:asparagine synthase (glutamine-hydrolysing)